MRQTSDGFLEAIKTLINDGTGLDVSEAAAFVTLALFVVGLVSGIIQVGRFLARLLVRIHEKFVRHPYEGLYRADIYDTDEKIIQVSDVVEVQHRLGNFQVKPIYVRNKKFNYEVNLTHRPTGILEGPWSHAERVYYGSAMLSPEKEGLAGYMLGNTAEGKSNVLTWRLRRTNLARKELVPSRIASSLNLGQSKPQLPKNGIERLISDHTRLGKAEFHYGELVFTIEPPACHPELSTFSRALLEFFEARQPNYSTVLDLGCGSGFYAVYLKDQGVPNVTAIDFPDVVQIAKNNAFRNLGNDHGIDFKDAVNDQVFMPLDRREKLDAILANLPFAPASNNRQYAKSTYFRSFAASDDLIFNLILGAKLHLKAGGALYFPFW